MPLPIALLLSAAGGLLTNLAFPYHSWWFMAPLGLALLVYVVHEQRMRRALLLGFTWGLAFFLPLLYWSTASVGQWAPWVALSALQALFISAFAASYAFVSTRLRRGGVVAAAVLWVAYEQLRGMLPFGGFPWGNLAFSQTEGPALNLAAVGGTVLVSGVVALAAAGVAMLVHARPSGLIALGVTTGLVVGGLILPPELEAETGTVRVAVVQGSVPVRGAEALGVARDITANYRRIAEEGAPWNADLMVWPESAADLDPRTNADVGEDVRRAQVAVDAPILLGTQRYVDDVRYNEFILWGPDGATAAYAKQHPVPFGEYMPYRDFFRRLSSAVDRVSTDMAAGTEPAVMTVPMAGRNVVLGTAICFEVVYDDLIREGVTLGAEAFIIPTNNASFGFTQESTQQLAMSRFRAVEHGRAVVHASTVGVSGVFAPDGSVLAQSSGELYTEWSTVQEIPLRTTLTWATLAGDAPRIALWVLGLLWLGVAITRKEKS